jgi:hypothetical protein
MKMKYKTAKELTIGLLHKTFPSLAWPTITISCCYITSFFTPDISYHLLLNTVIALSSIILTRHNLKIHRHFTALITGAKALNLLKKTLTTLTDEEHQELLESCNLDLENTNKKDLTATYTLLLIFVTIPTAISQINFSIFVFNQYEVVGAIIAANMLHVGSFNLLTNGLDFSSQTNAYKRIKHDFKSAINLNDSIDWHEFLAQGMPTDSLILLNNVKAESVAASSHSSILPPPQLSQPLLK